MTTYASWLEDEPADEFEEATFTPSSWIDNIDQDEDGVPGTGPKGQWTSIF